MQNILKDITIIGVLNKIEIWDNATLEKYLIIIRVLMKIPMKNFPRASISDDFNFCQKAITIIQLC